MTQQEEFNRQILVDFIKEDRVEIRMIKNRIYTNIQVLIGISIGVTAFFIERSMDNGKIEFSCSVKNIIIVTNMVFLAISWIMFYFQNKDLYFVRKCLTHRENELKKMNVECFGDEPDKTLPKFWRIFLHIFWKTDFENDGLLFFPMSLLTLIYIGVMIVVVVI
ncbi:MAG: hypothetical protein LBR55_04860 [Bacteroidales bacterium]|jgi:hypothetical protein|nr:hypothetical protein [Bacteroidales bacterium]